MADRQSAGYRLVILLVLVVGAPACGAFPEERAIVPTVMDLSVDREAKTAPYNEPKKCRFLATNPRTGMLSGPSAMPQIAEIPAFSTAPPHRAAGYRPRRRR